VVHQIIIGRLVEAPVSYRNNIAMNEQKNSKQFDTEKGLGCLPAFPIGITIDPADREALYVVMGDRNGILQNGGVAGVRKRLPEADIAENPC
jgi:hypothetical protein